MSTMQLDYKAKLSTIIVSYENSVCKLSEHHNPKYVLSATPASLACLALLGFRQTR